MSQIDSVFFLSAAWGLWYDWCRGLVCRVLRA